VPRAQAVLSFVAGIAYTICMQYTVRNVPKNLDEELRRRAHDEGKSLNEVALEAMMRGVGQTAEQTRFRDLSDLAGTWKDDPEFEAAIADQHTIDPELWTE
jgi:plasmid stability protein